MSKWIAPAAAIGMGLTEELQKAIEAERNMTPEQKAAWDEWHASMGYRFKQGMIATAVFAGAVGFLSLLFYGLRQ